MTLVNGAMAIGAGHCKHLPSSDGLTVGLNEGANTVKFYTFRWEGQVRLGAATDGGRLVDLASARQMRGEGVLPAYRNMQSRAKVPGSTPRTRFFRIRPKTRRSRLTP